MKHDTCFNSNAHLSETIMGTLFLHFCQTSKSFRSNQILEDGSYRIAHTLSPVLCLQNAHNSYLIEPLISVGFLFFIFINFVLNAYTTFSGSEMDCYSPIAKSTGEILIPRVMP